MINPKSQVFRWSSEKNDQLKNERGVGFEKVVAAIKNNQILDIREHPNRERYPSQRIFVIEINNYIYYVPFVESKQDIFLKTIIPSRKLKRQYQKGANDV